MYSVILMAALSTSTAEAPAFGHRGCGGCCGGMVVHSSCYGCSGCSGCYGCWGSCTGCTGCWGSCYGCSGCYGCMGCYGVYSGYSCCGCQGGWFASDSSGWGATMPVTPAGNPMQTTTPATTTPATPPATKAPGGTSAKVIIEKPVDGKIFVDNQMVKSEGARQTFVTPVLDPAQAYYYTVRVETVRDGKPTSETRRVIVRSGETAQETFVESAVVTASK